MLNENAQKWVDALRSGKYKQGRGRLSRYIPENVGGGFEHCCLGVACVLYKESGNPLDETLMPNGDVVYSIPDRDDKNRAYLPFTIMQWLGLRTNNACSANNTVCLPYENDQGTPFSKIADMIMAEPEGLFIKEHKDNEKSN